MRPQARANARERSAGQLRSGPEGQPGGLEGLLAGEILANAHYLAVAELMNVEAALTDLHPAPPAAAVDPDRCDDHPARRDELDDLVPGFIPCLQPPLDPAGERAVPANRPHLLDRPVFAVGVEMGLHVRVDAAALREPVEGRVDRSHDRRVLPGNRRVKGGDLDGPD